MLGRNKWEDTVMNDYALAGVWLKSEQGEGFLRDFTVDDVINNEEYFDETDKFHCNAVAKAQAEITGEIAYRKGMQKVVDWVNGNANFRLDAPYKSTLDYRDWQVFLKENNLK